jgi:hypothetical protein
MDISEGHIKQIVVRRLDRCRVCHRHYEATDVDIISRQDEMWMMSVECTDCHARNFVAAVLNEGDPEQAELALQRLNELTEKLMPASTVEQIAPEIKPSSAAAVTTDDVIDMHEFLNGFDGDFATFFSRS